MDSNGINRLNEIKSDIDSLIQDLGSLKDGMYRDFENIGNDKCAEKVDEEIARFRQVKKELNNIDADSMDSN